MEAGRHWAEAARRKGDDGDGKDEAGDDLKRMGATDEEVAEILGDENDDEATRFEVWPEAEPVILAFLRIRRCFRAGALGGLLGLDYPQVETVLRSMKVKDRDTMIQDLEAMADGAIKVLNRKE